jgi:hypothetical protein
MARAWAFLLSAYLLYIPANLLPIMVTQSIFGTQHDTILSGVIYLWLSGSHMLSLVVLIASIDRAAAQDDDPDAAVADGAPPIDLAPPPADPALYGGRSHRPVVHARYLRGGTAGLAGAGRIAGHHHARGRCAGLCLGRRAHHARIAELRSPPAVGRLDAPPHPSILRKPTMPEHINPPTPQAIPQPVRKPPARWLPSLVWLIPIVAAAVGLSLLISTLASRGPEITVTFRTAEGLTPGKTLCATRTSISAWSRRRGWQRTVLM